MMMLTSLDFRKLISGFLVFAILTGSVPAVALAQTTGGNPITSLVEDSVGAVAAALISCNETAIHNSIKSLFKSGAKATANKAANAIGEAAGAGGTGTQEVSLSADDKETLENISTASEAQSKKITCTRAIEKAVAGTILRQITISTVNWINNGLNGNPFYATDTGSSFKSLRDLTIKDIANRLGFDRKNYPFGQAVVQGLAYQLSTTFEQQARYSLNTVISQHYPGSTIEDFRRDFGIGGWDAFLSQSLWNNNPFGFAIQTQNQLGSRLEGTSYSPAQDLKDQLARSGGFFDQKICLDPKYDPSGADKGAQAALAAADKTAAAARARAQAAEDANARAADYYAAHPNDPAAKAALDSADAASAAAQKAVADADNRLDEANAKLAESTRKSTCKKWQVQTPGSVIAHALTKNMDTTQDSLINSDDLNADITAIFDALSNQLVQKGLRSLSSNTNTNSNADFSKNSNGTVLNNGGVSISSGPEIGSGTFGTWANAGANFNIFTDIPDVIRYEDNNARYPQRVETGCTSSRGFTPSGTKFCSGDEKLAVGYQQLLQQEMEAQADVIRSVYALDYCIPGPHAGSIDAIESNASSFVSNPNLFPASADVSDMKKVLATYGGTAGAVVGIAAGVAIGAAIGSAVPGLGTAIGAVVGLAVGYILQSIGNNKDNENEMAYGKFMDAVMGLEFSYGSGKPGREHLNGHDNTADIITTLAPRYKEALQLVYDSSLGDVQDADRNARKSPTGTLPDGNTADLSTTNAARYEIANASYNSMEDITDLIAINNSEYKNLDSYRTNLVDNSSRLETSISIESQLIRLVDRINRLPEKDGYPGLTADLDIIPVITLNGSKVVTVQKDANYKDAGATAYDKLQEEDITKNIKIVNNVNTNIPGNYTITYDAKSRAGVNANQVTRTVRVLDTDGNPGEDIQNYAAKNVERSPDGYSGTATYATDSIATAAETRQVRDYKKDYETIQNITNLSRLSDYEVELKRIANTFNQLAPYIHGPEDLRQEEALLEAMINKSGNIATYNADGSLKNGALKECIDRTSDPANKNYLNDGGPMPKDYPVTKSTPLYIRDGGPTARVAFSFTTDGKRLENLPTWLTDRLPPQQSFLPNWHYAQGQGLLLIAKNWFPTNPGAAPYPPEIGERRYFSSNYYGDEMQLKNAALGKDGLDRIDTFAAQECAGCAGIKVDYNKLIRNHDTATINLQPIMNAFTGLEHIVGLY